jgi:hypothetical protein
MPATGNSSGRINGAMNAGDIIFASIGVIVCEWPGIYLSAIGSWNAVAILLGYNCGLA